MLSCSDSLCPEPSCCSSCWPDCSPPSSPSSVLSSGSASLSASARSSAASSLRAARAKAIWLSCVRFISASAASAFSPSVSRHMSRMRCAAGGDFSPDICSRASRDSAACDRQLVLAGHAVVAFGLALLAQFRVQIGRDARHVARTDHLDARLFERVVDVLRLAARRHAGGVHRIVVMAQAQRDRVRRAAQPGHLGRRQCARRQRQARALAGQARRAGLECHLHVGHFRDRAQHAGGGALEFLGARVVLVGAAHSSSSRNPAP